MTVRHFTLLPLVALCGCAGLYGDAASLELTKLHQKNKCERLVTMADENLPFFKDRPELVAQAFYLKADCLTQLGRNAEAVALFRYVVEQHPESP